MSLWSYMLPRKRQRGDRSSRILSACAGGRDFRLISAGGLQSAGEVAQGCGPSWPC